ncbi:MAG: hypothetical protein LBR35_01195 [Rickettsiales bacterium]|nr:hypothetical protein [Rickettsiales bacterium]
MLENLNQSLLLLESSLNHLEAKLNNKQSVQDFSQISQEIQDFKKSKQKALIIINSLLSRIEELEKTFN